MAAIHAGHGARCDRAGFYGMDQKQGRQWSGSQPGPGIRPGALREEGDAMAIRPEDYKDEILKLLTRRITARQRSYGTSRRNMA